MNKLRRSPEPVVTPQEQDNRPAPLLERPQAELEPQAPTSETPTLDAIADLAESADTTWAEDGAPSGGWRDLMDALEDATSASATRAAALALTEWCRTELPDTELVRSYLAQPDVSEREKTATIGAIMAAVARNEALLGNAYYGAARTSWETAGANTGTFPDTYIETTRLDKLDISRSLMPWCTSFAGTAAARTGFDFNNAAAGRTEARGIFWSGYRLEEWAKTGRTTAGVEINGPGDRAVDDGGSAFFPKSAWATLKRDLTGAAPDGRADVLDAFVDRYGAPQAGDLVVIGKNNMYTGKKGKAKVSSHTLMVETFDAAAGLMSCIEGNAGNQVSGRTFDLTDPAQVSKIIHITRLGADQFDDPGNTKSGAGAGKAPEKPIEAGALTNTLDEVNKALASRAVDKGTVRGTDPSATISELLSGRKQHGGSSRTR